MTLQSIDSPTTLVDGFTVGAQPTTGQQKVTPTLQPGKPGLVRHNDALHPSGAAAGVAAASKAAAHAPKRPTTRDRLAKSSRIAIIDDEPASIQIVQKYLQDAGFRSFVTTSNSTEAMDTILREKPDLVLMDVVMPSATGIDVLHAVRKTDATKHLPVLFMTKVSDAETKRAAVELGATDFLHKPIDRHELVARVRNSLMTKAFQDELTHTNQRLEAEVKRRSAELITSREEVIHCLARTAEYRDDDSGQHVVRVGKYVGIMARELGFPEDHIELVDLASRLHDIGKIGIPDSIIQHPGKLERDQTGLAKRHCDVGQGALDPLTDEHWRILRSHTRLGAGLLHVRSSPLLMLAAKIAQTHHERWDGTGYPLGLAGDDIPIEGRMTAVADVYDVLSSRRPHKPPFPRKKCCAIMEDGRGTHFDPKILDAFFARKKEIIEIQIQYMDVE